MQFFLYMKLLYKLIPENGCCSALGLNPLCHPIKQMKSTARSFADVANKEWILKEGIYLKDRFRNQGWSVQIKYPLLESNLWRNTILGCCWEKCTAVLEMVHKGSLSCVWNSLAGFRSVITTRFVSYLPSTSVGSWHEGEVWPQPVPLNSLFSLKPKLVLKVKWQTFTEVFPSKKPLLSRIAPSQHNRFVCEGRPNTSNFTPDIQPEQAAVPRNPI